MLTDKTDKEIIDFVIGEIKDSPERVIYFDDTGNGNIVVSGFYIDIDSPEFAEYLHERLPDAFVNVYRKNKTELGYRINQALDDSGHFKSIKTYAKNAVKVHIDKNSKTRLELNPGPFKDALALTFSVPYKK